LSPLSTFFLKRLKMISMSNVKNMGKSATKSVTDFTQSKIDDFPQGNVSFGERVITAIVSPSETTKICTIFSEVFVSNLPSYVQGSTHKACIRRAIGGAARETAAAIGEVRY